MRLQAMQSWRWLPALCGAVALAQQAPAPLRHMRLHAVVSSKSIDNVNHNDARAAMKVWFDAIARQKGFILDSDVSLADSVAEVRSKLENRAVDLVVLSIGEYLEIESSHLLVPELTHGRGSKGVPSYAYLLVTNPAGGPATLTGLRGKNVLTYSRTGSKPGTVWVEVLLNQERLGRAASFFGSFAPAVTGQACILTVFFGRADACVVDEINLQLAQEMNPQLKRLQVIARSRPLIEGLVATPLEPGPYHKELFDALLALPDDPRGRQLLMIFKTDRLVPVAAGDFDSARELFREYSRLPSPPVRTVGAQEED